MASRRRWNWFSGFWFGRLDRQAMLPWTKIATEKEEHGLCWVWGGGRVCFFFFFMESLYMWLVYQAKIVNSNMGMKIQFCQSSENKRSVCILHTHACLHPTHIYQLLFCTRCSGNFVPTYRGFRRFGKLTSHKTRDAFLGKKWIDSSDNSHKEIQETHVETGWSQVEEDQGFFKFNICFS